ncbi:MAG TPA: hypothetical protein VLC91_01700 [Spongiibacteraceae bacterium]|nr:hypothetical protein [Spongiibacteraceae bacterium]
MAVRAELGSKKVHLETNGGAVENLIRRRSRLFGVASFILMVLLVATGLTLLFIDTGLSWEKVVSAAQQMRLTLFSNDIARDHAIKSNDSLPISRPWPVANPSTANSLSENAAQVAPKVTEASTPTPTPTPAPALSALSIPIADVSLRNRPELLEQVVQIYRSKLAEDPNNTAARAVLNQLQERSLSDLQSIILEADYAVAVTAMGIVSRLFPEAADSVRYKYLVARLDRMQSQDKSTAKLESAQPTSTSTSTTTAPATLPEPVSKPVAPEKAKPIVSEKNNAAAINSAATTAKNTTENISSSKPEIRAVSITRGTVIDDRFVPGDDGNAFMVEISYRNFDKVAKDESEVSLVARLGVPGDPTVLAEAPIEIAGDRGTKSVVMTSLLPGDTGEEYKLNFILNGEFMASRTVHVSRRRY